MRQNIILLDFSVMPGSDALDLRRFSVSGAPLLGGQVVGIGFFDRLKPAEMRTWAGVAVQEKPPAIVAQAEKSPVRNTRPARHGP